MKSLHKINKLTNINKKFYVFDVETMGLSARPESFIFGCIYGHEYKRVFRSISEFKRIISEPRFKNKIIFAHNAEFDLTVIFGHIIKNLDKHSVFNNRFISARNCGITFADSFNIFPFSVKAIGEQIGLPKLDLDDKFKSGNSDIEITDLDIEYCYRDCEIIYKALIAVFTVCGSVKITLAGLSLALFRNTYIKSVIHSDDNYIYDFFDSYYGGRVEAFKLGKVKAFKYDINSMYPYAMLKTDFPNPNYLKKVENPGIPYFNYMLKYHEGLAHCTVIHHKSKVGLLPYRHNEKLCFPNGTFSGCWNFNELRFAISTGIVEIIDVKYVVHGPVYETPFKEYVSDIYNLRKKSTGIYKTIYKLLLNSLYGKFAQKIAWDDTYFDTLPSEAILKLENENKPYEIKMFSEKRDDGYLRVKKEKYLHHTIPLFSSYITSFSRVLLLKYMLKHQKELMYVDTDSLCLRKEIKSYNSLEIGEMKKEEAIITEIFGNKSYTEIQDSIIKTKLKGVPAKAEKIAPNHYRYNKMNKTKESLRRGRDPGHFTMQEKIIKSVYDKRNLFKDGRTSPLIIK
jgi:hypothetical protein